MYKDVPINGMTSPLIYKVSHVVNSAHLREGTLKLELLEGARDDILHALPAALRAPQDI